LFKFYRPIQKKVKKEPEKKPRPEEKKSLFPLPSLFRHGTRILIDGFNQSRLISELRGAGVVIRDVDKKSAGKVTITVSRKDTEKTFAILKKLCYNYTVLASVGANSVGAFLLKKLALLLSFVLMTLTVIYSYGFIWRVEITGCKKLEPLAVERFLASKGYKTGAQKNGVDLNKVRSLVNSLDDILETTVTISGVTLKIEVVETTDFEKRPGASDSGIYSKHDAVVTTVVAESGTPLVKKGSRVFKGESLIGAYRPDKDGNRVPVKAAGAVYGEVTFTDTYSFSLEETAFSRTGKKFKITEYELFGKRFLKSKKAPGFKYFETEAKSEYVFLNNFIPLKMHQTVYYELAEKKVNYTAGERVGYFTDKSLLAHAVAFGNSGITVKTKLIDKGGGEYTVLVFTSAEILIGKS
jgi:sporulation protein YqfD